MYLQIQVLLIVNTELMVTTLSDICDCVDKELVTDEEVHI